MADGNAGVPVLVVGGGPAGVGAAVALAAAGVPVLLAEQRDRLGGAVHRAASGTDRPSVPGPARHGARWAALRAELIARNVAVATQAVFLGIDAAGRALLDDRRRGRVAALEVRGLVAALGAVERVRPFPGWELPGVTGAGGAQVLLKETGEPPEGPLLVAGSGPLNLALAAQLAALGAPPVALLERARPWRHPGAVRVAWHAPVQAAEAAGYAWRLVRAGVPWRFGARVVAVREEARDLLVEIEQGGAVRTERVRHLIVHDGLAPNALDLTDADAAFPIVRAGDGAEILGADAAAEDGRRAAHALLARLDPSHRVPPPSRAIDRARRLQRGLARLYATPVEPVAERTIVCRCEARRLADIPRGASAREARLVGRFGMGVCQGRSCAHIAAAHLGLDAAPPAPSPARWPIRPVSVAALAGLEELSGLDGFADEAT